MSTTTATLKAYLWADEYEGHIVFAATKAEADRRLDGCAERAPQYDAWAGLGYVPARVLIEQFGWHFDCHAPNCREKVEQEGERFDAEAEEYVPLQPVYVGQAVYCCPACNDAANAAAVRHHALATELRTGLLAGWPDVKPGECETLSQPPFILFRFPGSQCDASWELGADHIKIAALDSARYAAYKTLILPAARALAA